MKTSPKTGEAGFTLIELLVVCLVIGILASLAIPAMTGQRNRSFDASAKAGVRTAETTMETWYVASRNYSATVEDLVALEPSLRESPSDTLTVTSADDGYVLEVTSKSGNTFAVNRDADGVTRTCDRVTDGSCKKNGSW